MPCLAQQVAEIPTGVAKSFYAGYAVKRDGTRVLFAKGVPQNECYWPNGRTKSVTYVYSDGSKLIVKCNENDGGGSQKVIPPAKEK
jgi:hypothetical protein